MRIRPLYADQALGESRKPNKILLHCMLLIPVENFPFQPTIYSSDANSNIPIGYA